MSVPDPNEVSPPNSASASASDANAPTDAVPVAVSDPPVIADVAPPAVDANVATPDTTIPPVGADKPVVTAQEPTYYVTQAGDTLGDIADDNGVKENDLYLANILRIERAAYQSSGQPSYGGINLPLGIRLVIPS